MSLEAGKIECRIRACWKITYSIIRGLFNKIMHRTKSMTEGAFSRLQQSGNDLLFQNLTYFPGAPQALSYRPQPADQRFSGTIFLSATAPSHAASNTCCSFLSNTKFRIPLCNKVMSLFPAVAALKIVLDKNSAAKILPFHLRRRIRITWLTLPLEYFTSR